MRQKSLVSRGFANSTATIRCYHARYGRDAQIPIHGPPQGVQKLLFQAAGAEGTDGVKFKDIQLALPVHRHKAQFKKLTLVEAAQKATELRNRGERVDLLNPITINDKIGTVSLFFEWARARDNSVVNPVAGLRIQRARSKRKGKKRHPWTTDELNRMFSAPIYTGCRSEHHWQQPGGLVLNRSAKYWVPLIALLSGMRLGEIIQLRVTDVKSLDGIDFFDVTPVSFGTSDAEADDVEEEKSIKTASSRRGIPVHQVLFELGFGEFLKARQDSGERRLFPEYERARDDESWSKQFSKYFMRFRQSIGVTRQGVKFHSLRHNVEDALRNADIRKEVRDAIQGHGENGVSREYGSGYYVKTLNEAVQKIQYDGLRLPPRSR